MFCNSERIFPSAETAPDIARFGRAITRGIGQDRLKTEKPLFFPEFGPDRPSLQKIGQY